MLKRKKYLVITFFALLGLASYLVYSNPLARRWVTNKITFKETKHNEKFDITTYQGKVVKNLVYAENVKTYDGKDKNLELDIFLPEGADSTKKYPLVLCIHSGGFLVGDKKDTDKLCAGFAKNGFVAATINYRLGWGRQRNEQCSGDSNELKKAIYRAVQDTRASLRFLTHHATTYSIDTGWIFLQGASAGAVTTLHTTFLRGGNFEQFLPADIASSLGKLDNYGNSLTNSFSIKGICNCWGSFCDVNLITKENAVPAILFHGAKDNVTPFAKGHVYACDKFMTAYGSKSIYDQLQSLSIPAIGHFDDNLGHNLTTELFYMNNAICFFQKLVKEQTITSGIFTATQNSCP
jgi:predicted peptidase